VVRTTMTGRGTFSDPWDFTGAIITPEILAGHTLNLIGAGVVGDFTLTWDTGEDGLPVTVKPYYGTPLIDGSLIVSGDWVVLKGLHIKDTDFLDRWSDGVGEDVYVGLQSKNGIQTNGTNILIQDCIIENTLQGVYKNSQASSITIDGCIIYNVGWDAPDRPHGHGVYLTGNVATVKNSIVFYNAGIGLKAYHTDSNNDHAYIDNIVFDNFTIFGPSGYNGNLLTGNEAGAAFERPTWIRNCTFSVSGGTQTNRFGLNKTFYDATMVDNYLPDGCIILGPESGFPGCTWIEYSGNIFAPEVSNRVFVKSVRGRAHVAVYNWELADSAEIDLSTVDGLSVGDSVTVTNVQDLFVDIVTAQLDADKHIVVNMQAAAHSVQAGQGFVTPATTFPKFGCFVVEKV